MVSGAGATTPLVNSVTAPLPLVPRFDGSPYCIPKALPMNECCALNC